MKLRNFSLLDENNLLRDVNVKVKLNKLDSSNSSCLRASDGAGSSLQGLVSLVRGLQSGAHQHSGGQPLVDGAGLLRHLEAAAAAGASHGGGFSALLLRNVQPLTLKM